MERVALLSEGAAVTPAMLGLPSRRGSESGSPSAAEERRAARETDAEAERDRLLAALREAKLEHSPAAARLGVPRNTLRYRMEKHGLGPGGPPRSLRTAPGHAARDREPTAAARRPRRRAPAGVRWEPRRVTFLRARLLSRADPAPTEPEPGARDDRRQGPELRRARGRAERDRSGRGLRARAARGRVSATRRPRPWPSRRSPSGPGRGSGSTRRHPGASHGELPLGGHGDRTAIDADAKRPARALLEALAEHADPGTWSSARRRRVPAPGASSWSPGGSLAAARAGPVYRLTGSREVERGLTAFVGREAELRFLQERFEQARAGRGRSSPSWANPGSGSPACSGSSGARSAKGATWVEGQAVPFGQTIPFHPLIDLLRRAFGIDEGDPPGGHRGEDRAGRAELGQDLRPALPFVRHLLSVDPGDPAIRQMDAKLRRAETFDVMRGSSRAWRRAARWWSSGRTSTGRTRRRRSSSRRWRTARRPADARGADVPPRLRAAPRRPHVPHAPGADRPVDRRLHGLACGLLSADRASGAASSADRAPAEGNPFFVEEVLRSLQETGAVRREGARLAVVPQRRGARRARHGARRDPGPDPATAGRSAAAPRARLRRRPRVQPGG